ncbi:MAG TPA: hypothetical protein VMW38_10185, partial [Terriglobia bacterium]|nr:hypothetical protein [Terriglobia bacterium]
ARRGLTKAFGRPAAKNDTGRLTLDRWRSNLITPRHQGTEHKKEELGWQPKISFAALCLRER